MSVFEDNPASPRILSPRSPSTQIAKTYRQAVSLFVSRRFPEALSTIEPVITTREVPADEDASQRTIPAPIASASRGTRTKIWTFYLTFLHSVIQLGPEEGKHAFGGSRWKSMVARVRDGEIWEDIVQIGYEGVEANVDAEVVISLATLLVTHALSQKLTQQRMENYIAASTLEDSSIQENPLSSPSQQKPPVQYTHSLRLLEIYILHVLPRNQEWEYAREYVSMSEILGNDQKDAFLLALHELLEAERKQAQEERERQEMQRKRREAEARRMESEQQKRVERQLRGTNSSPWHSVSGPRPSALRTPKSGRQPPPKREAAPAAPAAPPQDLATMVRGVMENAWNSPTVLRAVLIACCVLLALGRTNIRQLAIRLLQMMWTKLRQTIGMGMKVSYI